jgi:hypothetical protein
MKRVINMNLMHGDESGRDEPSFAVGLHLLAFLDVILCAAWFAPNTTLEPAATTAANFVIMTLWFHPELLFN